MLPSDFSQCHNITCYSTNVEAKALHQSITIVPKTISRRTQPRGFHPVLFFSNFYFISFGFIFQKIRNPLTKVPIEYLLVLVSTEKKQHWEGDMAIMGGGVLMNQKYSCCRLTLRASPSHPRFRNRNNSSSPSGKTSILAMFWI